jgi:anti-sigma factor RsiW
LIDPSSDSSEVCVQDRVASSQTESSESPTGVPHREVRSQLSDYLDGSLGEAERRVIETHLESCRACRAFRDTLRQTVHALDTLPEQRAPAASKQRILKRVRSGTARVSS